MLTCYLYITQYSNPDVPERSCFKDSHYLGGKELFKRLCLPHKINTYESYSTQDEKTFDKCTREIEDEARK